MPNVIIPFTESMFTSTKFDSSAEKASAMNILANFVVNDFSSSLWSKRLYDILYLHMFGHIAHYNQFGFWDVWFSTPEKAAEWLNRARTYTPVGSPEYTWSDAERKFQEWLKEELNQELK